MTVTCGYDHIIVWHVCRLSRLLYVWPVDLFIYSFNNNNNNLYLKVDTVMDMIQAHNDNMYMSSV